MDTYSVFREIADSWGLLGMMMFFLGAVLMLFRPSAKQQHIDASLIPFRTKPNEGSGEDNVVSNPDDAQECSK